MYWTQLGDKVERLKGQDVEQTSRGLGLDGGACHTGHQHDAGPNDLKIH
jgi:hypothetical protein